MAIQIALGIVLAVIILALLPAILAIGFFAGLAVVVVAIAVLIWFNLDKVAWGIGVLALMATIFLLPYYLLEKVTRRFPNARPIVYGDPPYVGIRSLPLRVAVIAPFAVGVAAVSIGLGIGGLWVFEAIYVAVTGRSL